MSRTSFSINDRVGRGVLVRLLRVGEIGTKCRGWYRFGTRGLNRTAKTLALAISLILLPALTGTVSAQELFRGGVGDKTIVVARSAQSITVTFPPGSKLSTFTLDNPHRLVIDAKQLELPTTWSTLKTVSDETVAKVRVAAHPGKVRVVLDISRHGRDVTATVRDHVVTVITRAEKETPLKVSATKPENTKAVDHEATPTSREDRRSAPPTVPVSSTTPTVIFTPALIIPTSGPVTPIASPTATATVLPTPSRTPTPPPPTPTATPVSVPTVVPTFPPTARPITSEQPLEIERAEPDISSQELVEPEPALPNADLDDQRTLGAIDFETIDGEHVVAFRLTQPAGVFELVRRDARTFVLTIPHTGIATLGLALPQYPPQQFAGITFVHAQGGEPKLMATIGVEKGVKLTAVPNGNVVFVKVDTLAGE